MRARAWACSIGVPLVVAACAGTSSRAPATTSIALDDAIARFDDPAGAGAGASTTAPRGDARSRAARSVVGAPAPDRGVDDRARGEPSSSPRRVDVRLHEADLENALRMLADAARVPLVVDGDLAGTVTIELRDVDPVRALAAIAAAHGARVERVGAALVVREP